MRVWWISLAFLYVFASPPSLQAMWSDWLPSASWWERDNLPLPARQQRAVIDLTNIMEIRSFGAFIERQDLLDLAEHETVRSLMLEKFKGFCEMGSGVKEDGFLAVFQCLSAPQLLRFFGVFQYDQEAIDFLRVFFKKCPPESFNFLWRVLQKKDRIFMEDQRIKDCLRKVYSLRVWKINSIPVNFMQDLRDTPEFISGLQLVNLPEDQISSLLISLQNLPISFLDFSRSFHGQISRHSIHLLFSFSSFYERIENLNLSSLTFEQGGIQKLNDCIENLDANGVSVALRYLYLRDIKVPLQDRETWTQLKEKYALRQGKKLQIIVNHSELE